MKTTFTNLKTTFARPEERKKKNFSLLKNGAINSRTQGANN